MTPRAAALLALVLAGCGGPPSPRMADAGRLGQVRVYEPAAPPDALVFLFSDSAGWSPAWNSAAETLRGRGAAVIGVDLPSYLAGLRASDDGCHYLISEIEDLSKRLQRDLGSESYHSPILAGVGAGATLSYAALAQSPAATVAGAVEVDPAPALDTKVALCPGAPSRPAPGGGFSYGEKKDLPGFLRVETTPGSGPAPGRLAVLVSGALDAARGPAALAGLPLVELPATPRGPRLAVIYSGDGGWRDLDKTIGEMLSARGVSVVGVDSLRYFWRRKTPDRVAADLAAILRHYGEAWGADEVLLIGYSFGAGILPFAVNRLPADLRARVVQITLLGLGPRAPFEFKVGGWLEQVGVARDPYRDAPLVLPELQRIDPHRVQCVYGEDEEDSLCRAPQLAGAELIRTPGGHHFGGDYAELARRILAGFDRRIAARKHAP